jgi:hypothetical protein
MGVANVPSAQGNQSGIICVTRTNQSEPWINFEAGALAKAMESSRVCPLLIDVRPADVTGPLTTLQMQFLDKDGLFSVLKVLNQHCGSQPLPDEALRKAFEKWWGDFETGLTQIMSVQEPSKPRRDPGDMLEEILNIVRSIDKATNATIPIGLPISSRDWTIARFVEGSDVAKSSTYWQSPRDCC